jgi:hypothetical protein
VTASDLNTYLTDNLIYLRGRPNSAVRRDNNANYTTTSGAFVNIDATNLSITLTTYGSAVLLGFTGVLNTSGNDGYLDFTIDGARYGSAGDGIAQISGSVDRTVSMLALVTGLAAGSHTFKVVWGVGSGTLTLRSGNGVTFQNLIPSFFAVEVA